MFRVITNGLRDRSSNQSLVIPKAQKIALDAPCLALRIIKQVSRVRGAIQRKELCPPLLLIVAAIEKGDFWSPSTKVG